MPFELGQSVVSKSTGISGKVVEVAEPTDDQPEKMYSVQAEDGATHHFVESDLETAEG